MRLTVVKLLKNHAAGQREFDCGRRRGKINGLMHAPVKEFVDRAADGETAVSEFTVTGMNCNNCARHVTEAIQGVAGVAGADVRLEEGRATVRWRPDALLDAGQIVAAVKKAG